MRVITVVKFKQGIISISIFCVDIYKFSYWQKSYLVILLKVNKNVKLNLYNAILLFNLGINLHR